MRRMCCSRCVKYDGRYCLIEAPEHQSTILPVVFGCIGMFLSARVNEDLSYLPERNIVLAQVGFGFLGSHSKSLFSL